MAAFQDYLATPTAAADPVGLQARVDYEVPLPASPLSSACSGSPPPYSPSSYDGRFKSHGLMDCIHARQLCEEQFATLEAKMADLEADLDAYCKRSQCRCGRSNASEGTCGQKRGQLQDTWCRTKSFFDSIRQRVSNKSRRKSQDTLEKGQWHEPGWPGEKGRGEASDWPSEKGQGHEFDWPGENHPLASVAELPAISRPAELSPSYASVFELPAAYDPEPLSCPAAQPGVYPHDTSPYGHPIGHGQIEYVLNAGITSISKALPNQDQDQIRCVYELPGQTPISASHSTSPYRNLPGRRSPYNPALSPFPLSTSTSDSFFSPSPSSSVSTAVSSTTTSVEHQGPIFAADTTYSPVEYGQNGDGVAPWLPAALHHDPWTSTTAVAELPDTSLLPELDATQWLPKPGSESNMHINPSTAPSLPQLFGETRPIELASGGTGVQHGLDASQWLTSQVGDKETANNMVTSHIMVPPFQAYTSPLRPRPRRQPRIAQPRRNSWDYTTRSALDMPTSEDSMSSEDMELPDPPRNSAISGLPSQQRVRKTKASGLRRRQAEKEPMYCLECRYYPDEGPDQRKKMVRHNATIRHRRNTGQEVVAEGFACPLCGSMHSREDNLWQHVRKKHNMQRSEVDMSRKGRIDARRDTGTALRIDKAVGEVEASWTG